MTYLGYTEGDPLENFEWKMLRKKQHLRIVRCQIGRFPRKLRIKVTGNVLVAPVERRNVGRADLFLSELISALQRI